jgi:electron transfer flavoprotein beta subunit
MRILVPVTRVIDPYAKVRPLPDGTGMDTAGVRFDVNPFDEIAVEEAVRMKERDATVEIVVVTIGGPECEEQLRKALAMGADRAVLVETADELDSAAVATELAALVKELEPSFVLMGKQATDEDSNQAGQMLAAKLDWPQATFASKIEIEPGKATVTKETDNGSETLEMPMPCLITTDLRLNEPRYIALPGIIKARSKPLEKRPRLTQQTSKVRYLKYDPLPARPPGRKLASVDELMAALGERGLLQ